MARLKSSSLNTRNWRGAVFDVPVPDAMNLARKVAGVDLSDEDRASRQQTQDTARARTSDETGKDRLILPSLLAISDPVATVSGNGVRRMARGTARLKSSSLNTRNWRGAVFDVPVPDAMNLARKVAGVDLSDEDRVSRQKAPDTARARTSDETSKDMLRLPSLSGILDPVATMSGNGGRQDANATQGQDGRAAAVPTPGDTIGSRGFNSCGGMTEGADVGKDPLCIGRKRIWSAPLFLVRLVRGYFTSHD